MNRRRIGIALGVGIVTAAIVVILVMVFRAEESGGTELKLKPTPAENDAMEASHVESGQKLIDGGLDYLLAQRNADGGWGPEGYKPAYTALVVRALARHPDAGGKLKPVIDRAVEVLMSYRKGDGGFYDQRAQNYTTSVVVSALTAVGDPKLQRAVNDAVKYLEGLQIRPGEETPDGDVITAEHPFRGGTSYGKHGRPDLSNLGFTIEAWHEAGVSAESPGIQEAVIFLKRTQNRSESNPLAWAAAGENDGGFAYAPALKGNLTTGESKAGPAGPNQKGLRSYGSMTYVGFKSLLYAGLAKDDPNVQAAFDWIRENWRLDSNPNMPQKRSKQGLYYYYLAFARALRAWGQPVIKDKSGAEHNWRHELIDALKDRVRPDGSWLNEADRWNEGDPVLVTAYAVLALQEAFAG